tara:strand:+ start:981 stop:1373 length:393 start_codon:yes stop_codon:yes gene_type:complete
MKKISLLTKITFHIANIILIILYVYPGSILGWLTYGDMKKQPQITSDLSYFSANHVYAFMILSFLGWSSYHMKNVNYLFIYLFFISIFLELCHGIIPQRSFEFKDLFGNILGVLMVFLIFYCFQFLKKKL